MWIESRVPAVRIGLRGVAAAGLLAVIPAAGPAAERPAWRIQQGDVRVVVPLKPGGAFEAKASSIGGSLTLGDGKPLHLTGEISLDLTSIDTGIDLRNRHLREKYLEVAKGRGFEEAVLSEIVVIEADGEAFRGPTDFTGTLLLHGVSRAVTGTAEIRPGGSGVGVEASFRLTLTDFGIEPPEYMGVGVANKVAVKVVFLATPARAAAK
jgi:polyisoprenoid-binding protein YceI